MKTTLALSLLGLISIHSANAADTQFIDCHFTNSTSSDHVVVSLKDPQTGTFFYTPGIDDSGDEQNTGKLSLMKIEDSKTDKDSAQFSSKWNTTQDGSSVTVEFLFSMPKNLIFKASNSFKAGFSTTITDAALAPLHGNDALDCYSRIYPATTPSTQAKTTK